MAELYIFDPDDTLITILSNGGEQACPFWDAPFREELNQGSSFQFTAQGDHPDSKHLKAENQVAFKDKDGDFRLFVIKEPERMDSEDGPIITCVCEPAMLELNDDMVYDENNAKEIYELAPKDVTLKTVVTRILRHTRWKVGEIAELGLNTTHFFYLNATEALMKAINTWGGEFRDRVTVEGSTITGRYIDILPRRGADTGKRWEMDKDILSIRHQVQSYPKTALIGRGAGIAQTDAEGEETGGYSRKISFADVEWKKANGDPADKPKGQKWVGDLSALALFGRKDADGSRRHRIGIYETDTEDPNELLRETWEALQNQKNQLSNFELDVFLLEEITGYEHEKVRLGDTSFSIDRRFAEPIEAEERVIVFEYDIASPDETGKVEMGQFIDLYADDRKLDEIEAIIKEKGPQWDKGGGKPITDDRLENIIPDKPENVIATGLFQSVLVEWDFVGTIAIQHYEVYASQIQGFTPDPSNLVFRGKTSIYTHKADTNQQWYYRVRAVNPHNVPGPFSDEVSGNTARIITDDILFGAVNAEILADLAVEASKLDNQAVEAEKIANAAVGNAAIKNLAVNAAKIANLAVGEGQIENLAITNAKIANLAVDNSKISNLSADKINAGAIRGIDIWGAKFRSSDGKTNLEIVGGNVRLTQSNGQYVDINPDGLYGKSSNGTERFRADKLLVTSAALGTSNSNVYLAPDSNNEVRVVDVNSIPSDGVAENYSYRPIRTLGLKFGPGANGYIGTDGELRITSSGFRLDDGSVIYRDVRGANYYGTAFTTTTSNMYIGADNEVRMVNKGFVEGSTGDPIYRDIRAGFLWTTGLVSSQSGNLYAGTDDELRVTSRAGHNNGSPIYRNVRANGYFGQFMTADPGFFAYIGTDLGLRVTSRGLAGAGPVYRDVYASAFVNGSLAEYKDDIRKWEESALQKVLDTDIYKFKYQGQKTDRIGLVIGEGYNTPSEVIQNDGVDQYAMGTMSFKAIQELYTELKEEIAQLKAKIGG